MVCGGAPQKKQKKKQWTENAPDFNSKRSKASTCNWKVLASCKSKLQVVLCGWSQQHAAGSEQQAACSIVGHCLCSALQLVASCRSSYQRSTKLI